MKKTYLIIGSGVAGVAAAEAIRKLDASGTIVIVGDEAEAFYSRPGLAYLLTGEVPEKQLYLYGPKAFQEMNIQWVHDRAVRVDPHEQVVHFEARQPLRFDRLLLATGSAAVPLSVPGTRYEGVVKLDTLEDARRILRLARKARSAVVVGGGITALELVEGLRARGVETHYLLRGDRYWRNVLDETESRIVEHKLKEEGVHLHFNTELDEILGKSKGWRRRREVVAGVRTKDGRTIRCDMVAIAIGVRPRKALAEEAGLSVERGILVNESLQTDQPNIFAAGDVAQVYDPFSGRAVLDSLWNSARNQGTVAGQNMAGQRTAYIKKVPFNVTRLGGLTTTIIGTVGRGVDEDLLGIARGDSETWRQLPDAIAAQAGFDINHVRVLIGERRLVGAVVLGDQTLSQPLYTLIAERADITPIRDQLIQPHAPIADILADFWAEWRKQHGPSASQS